MRYVFQPHEKYSPSAITEYRIADNNIVTENVHKDLGIVMISHGISIMK